MKNRFISHNKFRRSVPPANSLGQSGEFPREYTRGITTCGIRHNPRNYYFRKHSEDLVFTGIGPLNAERLIVHQYY